MKPPAALMFRLLRGFLNWCAFHPDYRGQVHKDACAGRIAKDALPKKNAKADSLQREQLLAAYVYHTVNQLSLQEAWKRFCESIGLDGDKVFATFGLDVADLQRQPIDEHLVADEEAVAVLVEDMTRNWAEPM